MSSVELDCILQGANTLEFVRSMFIEIVIWLKEMIREKGCGSLCLAYNLLTALSLKGSSWRDSFLRISSTELLLYSVVSIRDS
jgi:hypothetical protein